MLGVLVEGRLVPDLDDPAEVHDGDPVADPLDHRQVVRDEHVGEAQFRAQPLHQVDDLGLDGDVEGRDRFVGDDQPRAGGQRAGDADALGLAAGELVRVAVDVFGDQPDEFHQVGGAAPRVPRAHALDQQRFGDDPGHGLAGVERGVRVLEDHLDVPAQRAQGPL